MIELAPETEALARRLAESEQRTIDETVRDALKAREVAATNGSKSRGLSPEAIAARKARIRSIAREIAALPDLDPRSHLDLGGSAISELHPSTTRK